MATPNFKNRTLYHGDNLNFLRGMNSETVHLIATDPPFNKNRDFHATPDSLAKGAKFSDRWSWERDVHEEWTDGIIDDWPAVWEVILAARSAYGNDMGAFLCWLGVRLMEMRRVLREDGSIYLHCDPTASHYIKAMMDAIFGWKNFRNEIVWKRRPGVLNQSRKFGNQSDTILFYNKSNEYTWHQQYSYHDTETYIKSQFRYKDEEGRRYRLSPLASPSYSKSLVYSYKGYPPPKNGWSLSLEKMKQFDAEGRLHFPKKQNGRINRKQYLDEWKGRIIQNIWLDIANLIGSKERLGYPTQKPLALYERIIKASSNPGDIVLDPFCGCATTPVAAERLGRQWIGMDIWDGAKDMVIQRLERDTILRADDKSHVVLPKVHIETQPPIRADDNEIAAPTLKLRIQRPAEPWQKISHKAMTNILADAQKSEGGVICAGCGRVLEKEFMQLDHITPKSDRGPNHILNRILLCGPCNRRKRNYLTLAGLMRENKRKTVAWMKDESLAKLAQDHARQRAEWTRDNFDSEACQALIKGE